MKTGRSFGALVFVSVMLLLSALTNAVATAATPAETATQHAFAAEIAFAKGEFEQALLHVQLALEIDPRPEYYLRMDYIHGAVLLHSRLPDVFQALNNEPVYHPGLRQFFFAYSEWALGRKVAALAALEKTVQIDPDLAIGWSTLAQLLDFGFGRTKEAIAAYEKAVATSDRDALNKWAKAYARFSLEGLRKK